jgi:sugar phosphate isomerase/epimerase
MYAGVDSYSYHRFLGTLRQGEPPVAVSWSDGVGDVVAEAQRLGVGAVSLQTCFIGRAGRGVEAAIAQAREQLEVVLAWGAPEGIVYGTDRPAVDDLLEWIGLAGRTGVELVRVVLGGPRQRGMARSHAKPAIEALVTAAAFAREQGVRVAVENHGDITAADLFSLIERVGADNLGVCFDTANTLRVGDDPELAAEVLGMHVSVIHLKDIEDPANEHSAVSGPCSVPYGTGVLPLARMLDTASAAGFSGPICIELGQLERDADERALVRSGLDWLSGFLADREANEPGTPLGPRRTRG